MRKYIFDFMLCAGFVLGTTFCLGLIPEGSPMADKFDIGFFGGFFGSVIGGLLGAVFTGVRWRTIGKR